MAEQYFSQSQQQRMQMVLAPQLRQSLELLQVPVMELLSLVQQEMEQNPTIEEEPTDAERHARGKNFPGNPLQLRVPRHGIGRAPIRENRDPVPRVHHAQPGRVVSMLVADADAVQRLRRDIDLD